MKEITKLPPAAYGEEDKEVNHQYRVHKKVKFTRADRIKAGVNPMKEKLAGVLNMALGISAVLLGTFLAIFPLAVALTAGEYRFFTFYLIVILLIAAMLVLFFMYMSKRNGTLTLKETEACFREDPVMGKCFFKYRISYDRVSKVYHTDVCPLALTPMAKNRKNPNYDKELWHFYNGSYIVAEDDNHNPLFGAVYDEELWKDLQEYCKNATFYTKEEYRGDMDRRRELNRKHDEYSQNYEGYIN